MSTLKKDFGFYPEPLQIEEGAITINTLPDLERKVDDVSSGGFGRVERDWVYSPLQRERDFMSGRVRELPYPSRVFRLPKTHVIKHEEATNNDHVDFHIWVLSFFVGMRLTTTEAGFVDATPIKPCKLIDFHLSHGAFYLSDKALSHVIRLAENFWTENRSKPRNAKRFIAAVHALFLGQYPQSLQFEKFIYLYMAIDACYALAEELKLPEGKRHSHDKRINWMCEELGIKLPEWGNPDSESECKLSDIRNDTLHEALYEDAPLGFNINRGGASGNLPLEMSNLICRLLVALIGGKDKSYLESSVDVCQYHRLCLNLK